MSVDMHIEGYAIKLNNYMHNVLERKVSDATYILRVNHGTLRRTVPEHKMKKRMDVQNSC